MTALRLSSRFQRPALTYQVITRTVSGVFESHVTSTSDINLHSEADKFLAAVKSSVQSAL